MADYNEFSQVEGLVGETDFKTTITREQLEARSAHLIPLFTAPIHHALEQANLTLVGICFSAALLQDVPDRRTVSRMTLNLSS